MAYDDRARARGIMTKVFLPQLEIVSPHTHTPDFIGYRISHSSKTLARFFVRVPWHLNLTTTPNDTATPSHPHGWGLVAVLAALRIKATVQS